MMALWRRGRPKELLHHSDQGSQCTPHTLSLHQLNLWAVRKLRDVARDVRLESSIPDDFIFLNKSSVGDHLLKICTSSRA